MEKELEISSRAFWDVDFEKLLLEKDKYAGFIIRKVFEHGTFNDIINVVIYYGKEKVTNVFNKYHFSFRKGPSFCISIFKS